MVGDPRLLQGVEIIKDACLKAGKACRAECGGFQKGGPGNGGSRDVGKVLGQPVIVCHPSIYPQHLDGFADIIGHCLKEFVTLIAHRLQHSPCNVGRSRVAGHAEQGAPGVGIPVWRTKAGKGRDKIDPVV